MVVRLITTAQEVARAEGVDQSGYRLIFNVGDDALNSVPHLHLHVIGGRKMAVAMRNLAAGGDCFAQEAQDIGSPKRRQGITHQPRLDLLQGSAGLEQDVAGSKLTGIQCARHGGARRPIQPYLCGHVHL